jgi:hypothetical protein
MSATYFGTLQNDHIDWDGARPDQSTNGESLRVQITVLGKSESSIDQGKKMAAILERLAQLSAMSSIVDPREWQREQRQDRPIPGRER